MERQQQERRSQRLALYQRVIELHGQKVSQRQIARELDLHRSTVRQWLSAGQFPECSARHYPRIVTPWIAYLRERWQAGCHNAVDLTKELEEKGFTGSYDAVRRYVAKWRSPSKDNESTLNCSSTAVSPRSMAWLLFKQGTDPQPEQESLVNAFCELCPSAGKATTLVQSFRGAVAGRRKEALEIWLQSAVEPETPIEIRRFADGLKADLKGVEAAVSQDWSSGQTEGQVNKLKCLKRQMYGRSKFDLLRSRLLLKNQ